MPSGNYMLATSNGDLNWVYLWNLSNYRDVSRYTSTEDSTPDYFLELPKGTSLENMRWCPF